MSRSQFGDGRDDHLVALGDTGWRIWRWALLRAAGFPAEGLDRFAAPEAAAAADALVEHPEGGRAGFEKVFDAEAARGGRAAYELAGDPLFREAVIRQNPATAQTMLEPLLRSGPEGTRNSSRRGKEAGVARYWSRYCGKNDTISFFGPVCWVRVDRSEPSARVQPGSGLTRSRTVFLERWALVAYADRLAADPGIRPWLPVVPQPTLALSGRDAVHQTRGEFRLSRPDAALLARCDGRRPAIEVVRQAVADPESGLRRDADGFLALEELAARELVRWGIDLPITLEAESVLRRCLDQIGDPDARERALSGYAALCAGRDAVADAAGDPAALAQALSDLDETFHRITGRAPTRAHGQMYAGRTVCYEDTVRDLDVTVGATVLDAIGPPLALLLTAARWLTTAISGAYGAELRSLHDELAEELHGPVPLRELWFLAQGLLFGSMRRPVDDVVAEFTARWARILRLDTDLSEATFSSTELAPLVAEAFPADRPAWAFARYHSPDVHIVARDVDAVRRGEFGLVLGELHIGWNALDSELFIAAHQDRAELLEFQCRDIPAGRLMPLLPEDWPRLSSRVCVGLRNPEDFQLGFTPAPGAEPDRLVPISALMVSDVDGVLRVDAPDGRCWPLAEVFGELLAIHTVDAFKLLGGFRHSPRVTIDRMVVARETWHRRAAELDFAVLKTERDRYLGVRRWRRDLGLPERVFVKVETEVKPFFVDLTSPVYVSILCTALRAARKHGPDTAVTVIEMMPTPEQAWIPDAAGRRYASELRMQVVDPMPSSWTGIGPRR